MSFLISPPTQPEWHADRGELIDLLRRDWPGIEVGSPITSSPVKDVVWKIVGDSGTLDGWQDVQGECQYLDGPLDMIARYAAWWRQHVPADQDLILYGQSYTEVIPLMSGMREEDVSRALGEA